MAKDPIQISVTFDEGINKIIITGGTNISDEVTISPTSLFSVNSEQTFEIIYNSGYELNTYSILEEPQYWTSSISENIITALPTDENAGYGITISITTKQSTTSYPKINSFTYHGKQINTINGKKIRYVHYGDNTYEMVYDEPTEDALAGTWVFNDTLDFSSLGLNQDESKSWSVNFTSLAEYLNAPNTIKIEYGMIDADEEGNEYLGYSLIYVYKPTSGISEPHPVYISNSSLGFLGWNASEQATKNKTITITSKLSEVTNGQTLLTWLQANATKQGATTPALISFTIAGTSYQAEEGMTWAEWVNSSYNTGGYYKLNNLVARSNSSYTNYITYNGINENVNNEIIYNRSYSEKRVTGGGAGN